MFEFFAVNWQWILLSAIVLAVLAVALLAKPVRVWFRVTAFILDLGASYKRNARAIRRKILISEVTYGCGNRDVVADLYRPDDRGRHSGLILAHGAIQNGKNDRALIFAGQSLARAGYIVLVPQLDNLCKFRLHQDDIDVLVASFKYLARQECSNGKVGMLGACLSAPLVLLAATQPSVSRDLTVVSSWGGFYNINEWLQSVLTQHYIYDGEYRSWKPRPVLLEEAPKWLTELVPNSSDRVCLGKMLSEDSADPVKSNLSTSGQAMYELLTNREPERAGDLWSRLDPQICQTLDNLSPHTKINKLKTKISIIHTLTDDVIPWVESCKLADAIDGEHKVYFRIFEHFYHVSIEDLLKARISNIHNVISELIQLYLYIYSTLYRL